MSKWPVANCSSAWNNTCPVFLMAALIFLTERKPGKSLGETARAYASEGGCPGSPAMDLLLLLCFLHDVRRLPRDLLAENWEVSFLLSGVQLKSFELATCKYCYQMTIKGMRWICPFYDKVLEEIRSILWGEVASHSRETWDALNAPHSVRARIGCVFRTRWGRVRSTPWRSLGWQFRLNIPKDGTVAFSGGRPCCCCTPPILSNEAKPGPFRSFLSFFHSLKIRSIPAGTPTPTPQPF